MGALETSSMRFVIVALSIAACSAYPGFDTIETGVPYTSTTSRSSDGPTDTGLEPAKARFEELRSAIDGKVGTLVTVGWWQHTNEPVHVEYSIDPGEWVQAPPLDGVKGYNEQLLVGIPFSEPVPAAPRQVPWRIVSDVDGWVVDAASPIEPGAVHADLPIPSLVTSVPDGWLASGRYLLTTINQEPGGWTGGRFWVAIYDRRGRPVWAWPVPNLHWSLSARVSRSGDAILWDETTRWSDKDFGEGSKVHRTWLDREDWALPTPGLHHVFVELPSGGIAWGSQYHAPGEVLVERRPEEAEAVQIWSCAGWEGAPEPISACEANSLAYDESTDAYLIGFLRSEAAVSVERQSGEAAWWIGNVPGAYRYAAGTDSLVRPQSVTYTPGGSLLVSSETGEGPDRVSTVRELTVNHAGQSVTEVWSYQADTYVTTNAYAERLGNGNLLHVRGSASEVAEVDGQGRTVWHLDFEGSRLLGRGELIEDLYDLVSPPSE